MRLKRIKLRNFRNYCSAEAELGPGTTIVLGCNGAGKTNLLEAAQYAVCGRSFRTSREAEMVKEGNADFRVEAEAEYKGLRTARNVVYERGTGARVNPGGGPKWLPAGAVLCFAPDDLRLIKGPPAQRRRFLDDSIGRRSAPYHRLCLEYQKVLGQRNSFLQRARAGLLPLSDITPWDRQLVGLGLKLNRERNEFCRSISPLFTDAYREISGDGDPAGILYLSQIDSHLKEDDPEASLEAALARSWHKDMERLSTGIGVHRDDLEIRVEGRSLKQCGSQGEQRTAVLALLLAIRRLDTSGGIGAPMLLLDDVMSELDPGRRRRLMRSLYDHDNGSLEAGAAKGQVVITAADASLFSKEELAGSRILRTGRGSILGAGVA